MGVRAGVDGKQADVVAVLLAQAPVAAEGLVPHAGAPLLHQKPLAGGRARLDAVAEEKNLFLLAEGFQLAAEFPG